MPPEPRGHRGQATPSRFPRSIWRGILIGLCVAALASVAAVARFAASPDVLAVPRLMVTGPGAVGVLPTLGGEVPPTDDWLVAARRALGAEPLASRPFAVAAAAEFPTPESAGTARAATLLNEALRRDPRSRPARVLLLRHYVNSGRLPEAMAQVAALKRLNSSAIDQMLELLGKGLTDPRDIADAMGQLARYPELGPGFVRGLVSRPRERSLLVRVAFGLPDALRADPVVRDALLSGLIAANAVADARRLFGPSDLGGPEGLVHSPDFADARMPPPFNWDLAESNAGVAERAPDGLTVSFYGRRSGVLAVQLLGLPPGSYRARVGYRLTQAADGALVARLRCATGDRTLGSVALDGRTGTDLMVAFDARVPASGCEGQWLEIVGQTVEGRRPVNGTVQSFALERAGR